MEILAFITARGGSKGIPNKNLIDLNGKPLIEYSINAAKSSDNVTKIFLSSDSDQIINFCKTKGVDVNYKRPAHLAKDDSKSLDVVLDGLKWLEENEKYTPDLVLLLQPTSPLRMAKHIDQAISLILENKSKSLVSVMRAPHNCIPESIMKIENGFLKSYLKSSLNTRQEKPEYFVRNGASIYLFTPEFIKNTKAFYNESTIPFIMDRKDSIDVDDFLDLKICSMILKERNS